MLMLAVETTGKYGSAAVMNDNGAIVSERSSNEMNHLTDIITLIDRCLDRSGNKVSDLTHIAASVGPGSFTGIRIGVSTARALGQSLDLPCISVPTLEAMMRGALDNIEKLEKTVPVFHICTVINARRHQTYGAVWTVMSREGGQEKAFELTETLPQGQHMIEEVMDIVNGLDGPVYMTGDGVDAYGDIIREGTADIHIMPEDLRYQDAAAVAEVAFAKLALGKTVVYDKLLPDYMRKTEAEMKLEEGTLSKRISEAMV